MNAKTVKVSSLVASCLIAVVAVFSLISSILKFTDINSNYEAKVNVYFIIIGLLTLVATAAYCFSALLGFKNYLNNKNDKDYSYLATCTYLGFLVLTDFLTMCFFGFDTAKGWVVLVLAIGAIVLLALSKYGKFENKILNPIFVLISVVLSFVIVVVELAYSNGFDIATNIFNMFMFMGIFIYLLFDFLLNNSKN